ncbi:MAG TPA: HAMP domain-containing protein [Acidimicrobiales bacterium]|nr:HAMP domain-containing protein [Acidimicrobiales bacterium]
MRRRITVAIIATAVAAIVLAGLGTILLSRIEARRITEDRLRTDSAQLAMGVAEAVEQGAALSRRVDEPNIGRGVLRAVSSALGFDEIEILVARPDGTTVDPLPDGTTTADLANAINGGRPVVRTTDGVTRAVAAAPIGSGPFAVVILRQTVESGLGPVTRWFLVAALMTVVIGAVVGIRLGRTLTRPVDRIRRTTGELAGGNLQARVSSGDELRSDELGELARSVNTLADSLERSRGLEQQFLLSVSHDLRTPLTSIRGFAEALTDGTALNDPEMSERAGRTILAQARRLERLVRDLLELARLDSRQFSLEPRTTDLGHLVRTTVAGFAPDADRADLDLEVVVEPGPPMLAEVDPDRLAQAVANLVENATKFASGQVVVEVSRSGPDPSPSVTVSVSDDGPGIAEEDLPHVFERLYVAKREPVRSESGSGLGLAIVRQLAVAMGGRVEATGAELGGARLAMVFPLIPWRSTTEAESRP